MLFACPLGRRASPSPVHVHLSVSGEQPKKKGEEDKDASYDHCIERLPETVNGFSQDDELYTILSAYPIIGNTLTNLPHYVECSLGVAGINPRAEPLVPKSACPTSPLLKKLGIGVVGSKTECKEKGVQITKKRWFIVSQLITRSSSLESADVTWKQGSCSPVGFLIRSKRIKFGGLL
ncbi:hypothetical protein L596_002272 [Steinernema carpocapsae]|uniref:Uncharacterized protein n=1 Tax=Steinernema carpocapsae TaxID=34508 RepID=A0A4U8UP11_STECR|nr:hypothetical protein L596_002272 [Steinernema carpocapsae]